mgnify:CR=1 FL=1
MKIIILAGGNGTRLWPLSRNSSPKQCLDFGEGKSLLQKTICRFEKTGLLDQILISTNEKQLPYIEKQVESIAPSLIKEILIEPCNRSTAPAIAWSIKHLQEKKGASLDEICLVCPSDHYFQDEEFFLSLLELAEIAAKQKCFVTFGIPPTSPETSYGYIKVKNDQQGNIFHVDTFVEKPHKEKAEAYLKEGGYYWNAGIFVFQIGHFLEELSMHAPSLYEWMQCPYDQSFATFPSLQAISFDHALMEKTSSTLMIPYPSKWSDLGSWDRMYQILPKDGQQNVIKGDIRVFNTKNSLIFGHTKPIVVMGLDDLVIIDTEEVILIAKKEEVQEIGQIAASFDSQSREASEDDPLLKV